VTERDRDGDLDARFEAIIAHWDDADDRQVPNAEQETDDGPARPERPGDTTSDTGSGPRGAAEDPGAGKGAGKEAGEVPVNPPWPVWRGPTNLDADRLSDEGPAGELDAGETAEDDDGDHFEPGPLAPLPPQEDLHFWGIVVGLTAGPLLLLWLVILRPDVSAWWTWLAVGLSVGGFVLLVMRQPSHRGGDDPDDGARV
jgi:hypothetical protein